MKPQLFSTAATITAVFAAAALAFGPPAQADPPTAGDTVVVMPRPGPRPAQLRGEPDESSTPPAATLSVQFVDGAGIDRDGTEGFINRDGTDGVISGPLVTARPQMPAGPAFEPARITPLPGI